MRPTLAPITPALITRSALSWPGRVISGWMGRGGDEEGRKGEERKGKERVVHEGFSEGISGGELE